MATMDDLLRQLHRRVAEFTPSEVRSPRQFDMCLSGWEALANQARRALEALNTPADDLEPSRLLERVARRGRAVPDNPDPRVASIAVHVGVVGDLLAIGRSRVARTGRADMLRLQANLHAALHATARRTLDVAALCGKRDPDGLLRRLADATELAARLTPQARASTLDRLTVSTLSPNGVTGMVGLWASEARLVVGDPLLVTGAVLTETAATLALLCAVAAENVTAFTHSRVAELGPWLAAEKLLARAARAWRRAAVWPVNIQLGGRQPGYHKLTKLVREAVRDARFSRLPRVRKVKLLREAVSVAQGIGELQAATVVRLANWRGLWRAHPRANLRPVGMRTRATRYEWDRLEWIHPERQQLLDAAKAADSALGSAATAFDEAVLPVPSDDWSANSLALVEGRITAGYGDPPSAGLAIGSS